MGDYADMEEQYRLSTEASRRKRHRLAMLRAKYRRMRRWALLPALAGGVILAWLIVQREPWLHWWLLPIGVLLWVPLLGAIRMDAILYDDQEETHDD